MIFDRDLIELTVPHPDGSTVLEEVTLSWKGHVTQASQSEATGLIEAGVGGPQKNLQNREIRLQGSYSTLLTSLNFLVKNKIIKFSLPMINIHITDKQGIMFELPTCA